MRVECCTCGKDMGEKEPFDNKNVTHGLCPFCYKRAMRELELFKEARRIQRRGDTPKPDNRVLKFCLRLEADEEDSE